ncbi:hypothetical protein [Bradyrhizobium sp. AUGA SZCCT0160]|uniref:hypothetical protein n=1 Tax=Bradyrhizobium sp. AUGA SZCCT0160 TaxID=2807662 RepID=UPI001BAD8574|nr:hypothetical protein [Bradyrhizobium sp. AUGA SZCCT0160]MBR1193235.1 hypothetical protein [Bradyrhizobium sp. AUGA SZCCT0160]
MVDITITAANVLPGAGAVTEQGTAGETITAGQALYKDSTGNWMKADADSAVAAARDAKAIALCGASANQPITVQRSGEITLGGMTAGVTYYLSGATAGGIAPIADVGTGEYFDVIGIAKSTTVMKLLFGYSGVSA